MPDTTISLQNDKQLSSAAPQFVQGMGLFSATAIVMGSMIGSGIFIVSAEMSRGLGSPPLLIAAWLVTGLMTHVGALSYGERAAMGISLWGDAVSGDSGGNDRGSGGCVWEVSWGVLSGCECVELDLAYRA